MKQTFTFYPSVIASTASTANAEIFDLSIEAFEQGEYLKSLHLLLDSINKDLRTSYSNPQGNEFYPLKGGRGTITYYGSVFNSTGEKPNCYAKTSEQPQLQRSRLSSSGPKRESILL